MARKKQRKARSRVSRGDQWSSDWIFILAVGGAAIGFNNVWHFPAIVAENGGTVFLLLYLFALLLIGLPLLMAEIMIGRRGESSAIGSVDQLIMEDDCRPVWRALGWIVTLAGFLVFSYLCVIASWMFAYALRAATGTFSGLSMDGVVGLFFTLASDPEKQLFWHAAFVVAVLIVSVRGIRHGLEPVIRLGTPILLGSFVLFALYGLIVGDGMAALTLIFQVDTIPLTLKGVWLALGQAVFSLGLGVGAVIVYSSYASSDISIGSAARWVIGIDLVAGLLAAIFVLSMLAGSGQQGLSGPLLLFQGIPYALSRMPGGFIVGPLFYLILALAAWLSALALLEPAVRWLIDRKGFSRERAVLLSGAAGWLLGIVTILSFNYWAFSFRLFGVERKLGLFDVMQIMTTNLLIPVGVVLTALFAGWALDRSIVRREIGLRNSVWFPLWLRTIRVVVPILLLAASFNLPKLYQ